jgi:hypothetical protein
MEEVVMSIGRVGFQGVAATAYAVRGAAVGLVKGGVESLKDFSEAAKDGVEITQQPELSQTKKAVQVGSTYIKAIGNSALRIAREVACQATGGAFAGIAMANSVMDGGSFTQTNDGFQRVSEDGSKQQLTFQRGHNGIANSFKLETLPPQQGANGFQVSVGHSGALLMM